MSLVAWYPLTNDTNDYSGNELHLTNNGAVKNSAGKIGECYDCQGDTSKYLSIVSSKIANTFNSDEFTFCAWFSANGFIASMGTGGTRKMFHVGLRTLTSVTFAFYSDDLNLSHTFISNEFYHYAAVYKDNKQYLYINGKLIGSRRTGGNLLISETQPFMLGKYGDVVNAKKLNDVRIYDHALSGKEIKEISQAKIAHYKMDSLIEPIKNLGKDLKLTKVKDIAVTYVGKEDGWDKYSLSGTWNGGEYPYSFCLNSYNYLSGKSYSFSCRIKTNVKEKFVTFGSLSVVNDENIAGDCERLLIGDKSSIRNFIHSKNLVNQIYFHSKPYNGMTFYKETDFIYIKDIMLTQTPDLKPYIESERKTYLSDCSGWNNHLDLPMTNYPIFDKDEDAPISKGAIKFNEQSKMELKNNNISKQQKQSWTVSCWIKTTNLTDYQRLINLNIGIFSSYYKKTQTLTHINNLTNDFYRYSKENVVVLNEWYHFATTYDQETATIKIYKNAVDVTGNGPTWTNQKIPAGIPDVLQLFDRIEGYVKDFRIYNTVLELKDIKQLYTPEINIDKSNNIRCSQIKEMHNVPVGFKKDASITYKEFSEIGEIKSGVHNLKLGDEVLPVLIDMDKDKGRWARIFYHNCKSGNVLFSKDNSFAEAKETNKTNPTGNDKYSILSKLEYFRGSTKSPFEFRLKYPTDEPDKKNIWKQTNNPTFEAIQGYHPIEINWNERDWGGLEYGNTSSTFMKGSVKQPTWFYAIGATIKFQGGIPSYDFTANDVELWVRINNYDLFANNFIENVSIDKKDKIIANEFNEIDN